MKHNKEMTLAQAAKELGLRRNFLRSAIHDGELEARQAKISGGFMYTVTPEALVEFARSQGIPLKGLNKYLRSETVEKIAPAVNNVIGSVAETKSTEASLVDRHIDKAKAEVAVSKSDAVSKGEPGLRLVSQSGKRSPEQELAESENLAANEELAAAQAEMTVSLAAYKKAAAELESKDANQDFTTAVDGLLRVYPILEQKMDSLMERVSEVQTQVRGMQKGVHQHMSKMEGSMLRYNQGFTGAVQDVKKSVSEVSQGQMEMRTSNMLTQKMVLDIRDLSGRMNQHSQSIKETLEEVAAAQDDTSRASRATQQKVSILQENLQEIQESMREVDKSLQWIATWRKKQTMDAIESEKRKGLKGFWSKLFGDDSPTVIRKI